MPASTDTSTSGFDFPDFAQEFLRRNPDYQLQYKENVQTGSQGIDQLTQKEMARQWGLEFPDCTRVERFITPSDLAGLRNALDHHLCAG
jgi:hypothetical protein